MKSLSSILNINNIMNISGKPSTSLDLIFLDIDGVLNGYNLFTRVRDKIFKRKEKIIDKRRLCLLQNLVCSIITRNNETNMVGMPVIVLTSSIFWHSSSDFPSSWTPLQHTIIQELSKYFIILNWDGNTNKDEVVLNLINKGIEEEWLESFCIFDDEPGSYVTRYLDPFIIQTSSKDEIKGRWQENTGLKKKHIKKALKILFDQDIQYWGYNNDKD